MAMMNVLPSLRVIAVSDYRPAFRSEAERLGSITKNLGSGADPWEETTDGLEELKQLAADRQAMKEWLWWRVDGSGSKRKLVEIWDGKGELARECIERPDFDLDKDLDCECASVPLRVGTTC